MKRIKLRGFAHFVVAGMVLAIAGTAIAPAMAMDADKKRPVVREYQLPRYQSPGYESPHYGAVPPSQRGFRNYPPVGNEFLNQRGPSR